MTGSFPLIDVSGVVHLGSRVLPGSPVCEHEFQFGEHTGAGTGAAVVERVVGARMLTFWDGEHPTYSDPGAYISVVRRADAMLAMRGNHGWSSDWVPISEADAGRYLALCMPFHALGCRERCQLSEPADPAAVSGRPVLRGEIDFTEDSTFRRYLARRLG